MNISKVYTNLNKSKIAKKAMFLLTGALLSGASFAYVCPNATDPYHTGNVITLDHGHWVENDKTELFSWKSENLMPYPNTATLEGEVVAIFNPSTKEIGCMYNMDGVAHHSETTLRPSAGLFKMVDAIGSGWVQDGDTGFYSCDGYGCQFELEEQQPKSN
ncbi:MAG: hypothetical protein K0R14_1723 [Burkholderiales bacterium]|jgi:hypothetical protein|nr:hypothetical protein [Burkholderiales bacterium]